jgi:actin-related protein
MTNVWRHMFHELAVSQEEVLFCNAHSTSITLWHISYLSFQHPILITESPLNPRKNRGKTAEVFFETFNAPALYVAAPSILSLYNVDCDLSSFHKRVLS